MKIYIDSGGIRFIKIINRFGKKKEIGKNIYVAGCDSDHNLLFEQRNTKISEQIEGEAYAFLSLVNYCVKNQIKKADVFMDNVVIFNIKKERTKTKAKSYIGIAEKIAKENNIELNVEGVPGKDNIANEYANKTVIFDKENK